MMDKQLNYAKELAFIASKTKNKKLANLSSYGIPEKMESLSAYLGLSSDQILMFIPIFNANCDKDTANISDIADFYELSTFDIMAHAQDFEVLQNKSYIIDNEPSMLLKNLNQIEFKVNDKLFDCILNSKEISEISTEKKQYSQFDFVAAIEDIITENKFKHEKNLSMIERFEKAYPQFEIVKKAVELCPNIVDRIVLYYCCNDFNSRNSVKELDDVLDDALNDVASIIVYKDSFKKGTSPLIKNNLVYAWETRPRRFNMELTDEGAAIFLQDYAAIIRKNQKLTNFEFVKETQTQIDLREEENKPITILKSKIRDLERHNCELPLVQETKKKISSINDRILFYSVCCAYSTGGSINLNSLLDDVFDIQIDKLLYRNDFKSGKNELVKKELVELSERDFFGDNEVSLSEEGKRIFLGGEYEDFEVDNTAKDCKQAKDIKFKELFYEPELQHHLKLFKDSLKEENFTALQLRLADQALPTGVAALFYGAPGTGKTESVYQIAKATGRSVYKVDISEMKTCWYGESQKLVRKLFKEYKKLCKKTKLAPILLFNEADAIFTKRLDNTAHSVDQTENAIQNIILEEMENLEGILIATTNLENNLDPAFERRFLFKLKFEKPSLRSKISIWKDKIPSLGEEYVKELASKYDFSGGEIDNIARKLTMSSIINNKEIDIQEINEYCANEKLNNKSNQKIGY